MIDSVFSLSGVVLTVVGFVCVLFGSPMLIYYLIQMGRHKKDGSASWHDFWGWHRNNLIFFPALLDEDGCRYRERALWAVKMVLTGALCGVISMFLLGKLAADTLV
jgi:hypothetical protein